MSLVLLLLRSSTGTIVLAVVAGLAGGAGSVGLLALIHRALSREDVPGGLLVWGFAELGVSVLAARIVSQVLLIRIGQSSALRLCTHLSGQILATPLRQLEKLGIPRLLAALTEDVPAMTSAFLGVPVLCVNAAIVLCCLVYLAWLAPTLFLVVLGFLAAGVLSYQLAVVKAGEHLHRARQQHDALMKHFRALTEGVKELKMHHGRREAFLRELLEVTAARLRDRNTAGLTLYAAAGTWGQLLFLVCLGVLLFSPAVRGSFGRDVLSGYALTVLYAVSPLETIMTWLPVLGRAQAALQAVEGLGLSLDARDGEGGDAADLPPPACWERLELLGVTHGYDDGSDDRFRLGPVDLSLSRGELLFVVGGNGSGKTTLAKLLVGLYAPAAGEVRLNGRRVGDPEQYRQLFSAVFTDAYLFDRLLGRPATGLDDGARDYLTCLGLGDKVRVDGGRFSTTELSHGQRKRLALLTAYLEDRPVYVFDEWAADQDPRFKEVFYTRLLPELKARGKAVLVVSHDEQYFHVADRVVRLDYGKLHEKRPEHDCVGSC
jgi:putative pyoverdin transport system ATP-binding/permease protein